MTKKEFESLKVGDRVRCNYGSDATVVDIGFFDSFSDRKMVKLKVDEKKWACPYFFISELKCKLAL